MLDYRSVVFRECITFGKITPPPNRFHSPFQAGKQVIRSCYRPRGKETSYHLGVFSEDLQIFKLLNLFSYYLSVQVHIGIPGSLLYPTVWAQHFIYLS